MFMWIGWHQRQLQFARLILETILVLSLISVVPYTVGYNVYLSSPHANHATPWLTILGYTIVLIIPWLIGLISFVFENNKYHKSTNNSWWTLLKKRKFSFLKVSFFFERMFGFVLVLVALGMFDSFKHLVAPEIKTMLQAVSLGWLVVFSMLTVFRFMVRRAQMMEAKEETKKE